VFPDQSLTLHFVKEHAVLPIRTILHPTDFSERSASALTLACALARDYGARLVLVHVAARQVTVYGEVALIPESKDYLEPLTRQLDLLPVPGANLRVERRFEEGDAPTEILRVAQETGTDLIVMGTHGRTGLERLVMGSVAEQVVRQAACPVLTVKTPFPVTESKGR
jgi:nucleotide-binding universal stress UspA family protein